MNCREEEFEGLGGWELVDTYCEHIIVPNDAICSEGNTLNHQKFIYDIYYVQARFLNN